MKILLIVPSNENAGPVNVVKYLTSAVSKSSEVEFTTLCLRKKNDTKFENSKTFFLPKSYGFWYVIKWLVVFFKDNQFDICHSHGFFPDLYNFFLKVTGVFDFKSITTIHNYPDLDYPLEYGFLKGNALARVHLFILKKLHLVVGCSQSVSENLENKKVKCETIRNGVALKKAGSIYEARKNKNVVKLLFLGRLIKRKNFADIANAFIIADDEFHSKFELTVCGDGPELQQYQNALSNYPNVKFMGHVNEPSAYINNCDILVSTSLAEGFPLSVLEAVQARKLALLSNIGPHLELESYLGDSVICYSRGNAVDLISKLVVERSVSNLAKDKSAQLASAERMLNEYIKKYQSLLIEG
jgi:glycosyltransferase involved in cell wall biosynthesis